MTDQSGGPNANSNADQFQVAPRGAAAMGDLAAFEQALQAIPGAVVVSRAGRPDQPRLIVSLAPETAEQLRSRFGATLIIEKNAKLNPL